MRKGNWVKMTRWQEEPWAPTPNDIVINEVFLKAVERYRGGLYTGEESTNFIQSMKSPPLDWTPPKDITTDAFIKLLFEYKLRGDGKDTKFRLEEGIFLDNIDLTGRFRKPEDWQGSLAWAKFPEDYIWSQFHKIKYILGDIKILRCLPLKDVVKVVVETLSTLNYSEIPKLNAITKKAAAEKEIMKKVYSKWQGCKDAEEFKTMNLSKSSYE